VENVGLTGGIPDLTVLASLTHLTIADVPLNGTIDSSLFTSFPWLRHLNLSGLKNMAFANGTIPSSIFDRTQLTHLEISRNPSLNTTIPTEIESLVNLEVLKLRYDNLYGSIPIHIVNLTALHTLDLGNNRLSGDISNQLWQFLCDADDRSTDSEDTIRIVPNDFTSPVHSCVDEDTLPKFYGLHNITGLDRPTFSPTISPTSNPSASPTLSPTSSPITSAPTDAPTQSPTMAPVTSAPTESPVTSAPTESPVTSAPTMSPTAVTLSPAVKPYLSSVVLTMVIATISALVIF